MEPYVPKNCFHQPTTTQLFIQNFWYQLHKSNSSFSSSKGHLICQIRTMLSLCSLPKSQTQLGQPLLLDPSTKVSLIRNVSLFTTILTTSLTDGRISLEGKGKKPNFFTLLHMVPDLIANRSSHMLQVLNVINYFLVFHHDPTPNEMYHLSI